MSQAEISRSGLFMKSEPSATTSPSKRSERMTKVAADRLGGVNSWAASSMMWPRPCTGNRRPCEPSECASHLWRQASEPGSSGCLCPCEPLECASHLWRQASEPGSSGDGRRPETCASMTCVGLGACKSSAATNALSPRALPGQ